MPRKASKASVWKLASEHTRRKNADANGYVACVTCSKVKHWKEMDAGHFIPKARGEAVRYEETNLHPQCTGCNRPKYSCDSERVKIRFTLYMVNKYGQSHVEWLERKAREVCKSVDFDAWAEFYRAKLKELDNV